MLNTKIVIKIALLSLLLGHISIAQAYLPQGVRDILRKEKIPGDSLSILIQPIDSKKPLIAHNIHQAMNPASVIKIVTTYAALHLLGPEYTWKTEFYIDGDLRGNTLFGDLIVKGYGDPYLVEETLLPILRSMRKKGLRHITGKLIIDNSHFAPIEQDPGEFDNKPHRVYNANPSALMTNFQATRFTFTPDTDTGQVNIDMWPESPDIQINNEMQYVKGKCRGSYRWPRMWFDRVGEKVVARFKGKYSSACGQHYVHRAVSQPEALFYGAFYPTWQFLDGSLNKGYASGKVSNTAKLFHTTHSRPLSEIIRLINKFSNNVMTKQLLLTIASESRSTPATLDLGRKAIDRWLSSQKIDTKDLYIDNGSGLSRNSRISAKTLGQIMRHQWNSPWMPEIVSSYSILGRDGTGKKRLKNSSINGNMHLKTGLLDHVRSIAGFYHGDNGKRYIIIALHNHENIHKLTGTRIQDELIKWIDSR